METRLVEATIRAPRIATFVKAKDLHWQDILRIIETYSKIWGGAYDIIVPIRDKSIDQVFKAILKKYDPDFLWVYPKHQLDTERLTTLIDRYINPFENGVYVGPSPSIPHITLPLNYLKEKCSFTKTLFKDKYLKLIAYSMLGKDKFSYEKEFKEPRVEIKDITQDLAKELFFNFFRSSPFQSSPFGGSLTHLKLHPLQGPSFKPELYPSIIIVGNSLSDFLLYYDLLRLNFGCVFIPTDLLDKFIDFNKQNKQGQSNLEKDNIINTIWDYIFYIFAYYSDEKIKLVSLSEPEIVIPEIWEKIKRVYSGEYNIEQTIGGDPRELKFSFIPVEKLISEISKSDPVQIYYSSDQIIGFFDGDKLILDLKRKLKYPLECLNFMVDLKPKQIKYPPKKLLNQIQIVSPSYINYRISHSGITIYSEFEKKVEPINMKILNASDIFSLLLKEGNFSCELSDKGKYFKETLNKFEGITEIEKLKNLAEFVRSEKYVLIGMYLLKLHNNVTRLVSGKEKKVKTLDIIKWHKKMEEIIKNLQKNGKYNEREKKLKYGLIITSNKRAYFTLEDLQKILNGDIRDLVQTCIEREILRYGFLLKCKYCDNKDFYSLSEISDSFYCKRCGNKQKIIPETLSKGNEPKVVYDLNEIVFQCFLNNGDLPILTLDYFRKRAKETFMFSPEFKIYKNNQEYLELDIASIRDGKIIIGECKKTNENWDEFLGKKDRFSEILEIIQPDIVVFSTLDKQRPDKANNGLAKFINEIQEKHNDIEFINLNREDLLGGT